jgi:hypothetical protein
MSKGTPFFLLEQVAIDAGAVAAGAKLYFYQTGTSTAQTVYKESTLTTSHAQPVVADSDGKFDDIWLDPDSSVDYRVKLTDSSDTQLFQIDAVPRYRENFISGSGTITWGGFSADPGSTTYNYYRIGRMCFLTLPVGAGTSNSTAFTATGLPTAIRPDSTQYVQLPLAQDNSAYLAGGAVASINGSGQITFLKGDGTAWTASGSKGIMTAGDVIYRVRET